MGKDGTTLLNISAITGGSETNIIPGFSELRGEVRAYSKEAMAQRLTQVAAFAREVATDAGATTELIAGCEDGAPPLSPAANRHCVAIAAAAAAEVEIDHVVKHGSETLEASFLDALGIPTLGVASGGRNPHSTKESIVAADIDRLVVYIDALLRHTRRMGAG